MMDGEGAFYVLVFACFCIMFGVWFGIFMSQKALAENMNGLWASIFKVYVIVYISMMGLFLGLSCGKIVDVVFFKQGA